ncbi:hypothetical protein U1Q18_046932, partial [Sarracenia purpurea var. burkii]
MQSSSNNQKFKLDNRWKKNAKNDQQEKSACLVDNSEEEMHSDGDDNNDKALAAGLGKNMKAKFILDTGSTLNLVNKLDNLVDIEKLHVDKVVG